MINVLYFSSFRDTLGKAQEQLKIETTSVDELLNMLAERGENWAEALRDNPNLKIAVNHDLVQRNAIVKSGDEVAFFPPVTGG